MPPLGTQTKAQPFVPIPPLKAKSQAFAPIPPLKAKSQAFAPIPPLAQPFVPMPTLGTKRLPPKARPTPPPAKKPRGGGNDPMAKLAKLLGTKCRLK